MEAASGSGGNPKQLRLALVCYGGSSLCIYMHGITKEIHRLVKASAGRASGQASPGASDAVYRDLLQTLEAERPDDPGLRVVVDVVSGTSAGGINGIFLAKGLAGDLSLDVLRDLWFVRGDMKQLIHGSKWIPWPLRIFPRALKRSPLRGDDMARWLYGALQAMDRPEPAGNGGSLVPAGHPLSLFVTITDFYGYDRVVPAQWPKLVHDSRHRHALAFGYDGGERNDFRDNAGLAFAARTTSCIPAVFPPVRLSELGSAIGAPLTRLRERGFRAYDLTGADPEQTYFVDGGVLDNKPFGWAIQTVLEQRPADCEVDRRLLYIEPDPAEIAEHRDRESPETLPAALG